MAMWLPATVGVPTLYLTGTLGFDQALRAWVFWWLGDAAGVILAGTPLLATTFAHWRHVWRDSRLSESVLLLLGYASAGAWLFGASPFVAAGAAEWQPAFIFLPFALTVWTALRLGLVPAASAVLLLTMAAAWGAAQDTGAFQMRGAYADHLALWSYMVVSMLVVLLLSALVAERERSHAMAQAMFLNADVGLLFFGAHGRILNANPAALRLFEADLTQLRARTKQDLLPATVDEAQAGEDEGLPSMLSSQGAQMQTLRGRRFDAEVSRFCLAGAQPQVECLLVRDVTQREQASRELQLHRRRLELALEAGRLGAWSWDGQSGLELDARCRELLGLGGAGLVSVRSVLRLMPAPTRHQVLQQWRGLGAAHAALRWPFPLRRDGRQRELAICALPFSAGSDLGHPCGATGTLQDLSDELAAQQALIDAAVARRASDAKTVFLSRMSHELRTPLNAVIGFAQLIQMDQPPAPGRVLERVEHILKASRHLLALISDALDLARVESGALTYQDADVDLVALARDTVGQFEQQARSAEVNLQLVCSEHNLPLRADPVRLSQVLGNLVSNAIKYNHRGGGVQVHLERHEGRPVVRVVDNGWGLRQDQLEHLFEPFNRLGAERTRVSGTGIGLTVVKAVVEGMGGQIRVASQAGAGSEFVVTLAAPMDPIEPPRRASTEATPGPIRASGL
jgi:signal transduction histidine kinase